MGHIPQLRRLRQHPSQRRTTQWHWYVFGRDRRATTFNSRYYRTGRQANKQTVSGLDPSDNLIRISLHHPIRHITAKSAGFAPSFDNTSSFWPTTVVVVQCSCYRHYWKQSIARSNIWFGDHNAIGSTNYRLVYFWYARLKILVTSCGISG